jgi:hypothetical protein
MIAAHLTGAFPALPARVLVAVDDSRASRLAIAYA